MRVLIQHTTSKKFLTETGAWTAGRSTAKNFQRCAAALDYIRDHLLPNASVYLAFPEKEYDLPLSPQKRSRKRT
jgi:hypothetical protein